MSWYEPPQAMECILLPKGRPSQGAKLFTPTETCDTAGGGSATFGSCFDVWTWGLEGSVVTTLIYYEITHYHQIF
jgi:hypothetical protein